MTLALQTRVPSLRFKDEYGDDYPRWEANFVRDICEINPSNGSLPNQFTYIDLDSVYQGMLVKENKISKTSAPSRAQRILKENDVLFQTVRPYQQNNFFFNLTGDYVASTGYAQLRTKSSPLFLYYLLHEQKFVRKVLTRCTGTSYPAINSSDIGTIRIHLPDEKEQQKIAAFLSAVDTKIEQLNRKKSLLEQYKKGMMQKLFSQEIRFKDEAGRNYPDWEEKRVGDVCKIQGGYAFKSAEFLKQGVPIIRISNISMDLNAINEHGLVFCNKLDNQQQFVIKKGDLLIAMSGATTGKSSVYNLPYDAYLNQRVGLFRAKKSINYRFLTQFVFSDLFSNQLKPILVAGAQPNISSKDIERLFISLPNLTEQQKIAGFLSTIDRKIELVAGQIEQACSFKQGLLQQMFI